MCQAKLKANYKYCCMIITGDRRKLLCTERARMSQGITTLELLLLRAINWNVYSAGCDDSIYLQIYSLIPLVTCHVSRQMVVSFVSFVSHEFMKS